LERKIWADEPLQDEIDPLWEKVLLCQFHDVLPGSALGMVYEDVEEIYAEVHEKGRHS
jgi:alpha-mannosidase